MPIPVVNAELLKREARDNYPRVPKGFLKLIDNNTFEINREFSLKDFSDIEDFWGNQMPMMTMEELGELIQAISKVERGFASIDQIDTEDMEKRLKDVIAEMADVYISCRALMVQYGIDIDEVEDAIEQKLDKRY